MITPHEKKQIIYLIGKIVDMVENLLPTTTPCTACKAFNNGFCSKWQDQIPPENIEAGCDSWQFEPLSPPF